MLGFEAETDQTKRAIYVTAPGCSIKGAVKLQEDANSPLFKLELLLCTS